MVLDSQWVFSNSQRLSQNLFGKGGRKRRVRSPATFTPGAEPRRPGVQNRVWSRGPQTGTADAEAGAPWGLRSCLSVGHHASLLESGAAHREEG